MRIKKVELMGIRMEACCLDGQENNNIYYLILLLSSLMDVELYQGSFYYYSMYIMLGYVRGYMAHG